MNYSTATHPVWQNTEHTTVTLMVEFDHIPEPVPFTASLDDVEAHGRELFMRAAAGEFGPVAAYVAPTALEVATRVNPSKRAREMQQCIQKAQHWEMMVRGDLASLWREHYKNLYELEQLPSWPLVEQWPIGPTE